MLDLSTAVNMFLQLLFSWDRWQEDMGIDIRHLKRYVWRRGVNPCGVCLTEMWAASRFVLDYAGRNYRRPCWKAAILTPRRASALGCGLAGPLTSWLVQQNQLTNTVIYYCVVVLSY